jgi:cytochrome c-type biogenesis protein CcmH
VTATSEPPVGDVASRSDRATRERFLWGLMLVVLVTALAIGAVGTVGDRTAQDRVTDVSRTIKCPTCQGESVADSNAEVSKTIRRDIAERVSQGQTDEQIRAYYVSRYGEAILLTPSASGATATIWVLPVLFAVGAVAGLVVVFRRWQRRPDVHASAADRTLVEQALRDADAPPHEDPADRETAGPLLDEGRSGEGAGR